MEPKIRVVNKFPPPWPLNEFPEAFARCLGKELIARLAVDHTGSIEGVTWEQMLSVTLGAKWQPSNVGLDDVVLRDCAWGAKTGKSSSPFNTEKARFISGRNDLRYSYGKRPTEEETQLIGKLVLEIWNKRVSAVKKTYRHTRTIVLLKPNKLIGEWLDFAVFEFETVPYLPEEFEWSWNKNKNLIGKHRSTGNHWFTWQPGGAQFTIIHKVPEARLRLQVKRPTQIETGVVLKALAYDDSWVRICSPK